MSELPGKGSSSRVLVALESSLECLPALESAADLAADMRAELVALFIEDLDLFHLADLPFAREIDRASGLARRLDSFQMARALRAQAHEVRRILARATEQRHIQSSFRVVRGHFVVEALSAATEKDVLFLRGKCRVTVTTQRPALGSDARASDRGWGKRRAERGPVCVLYDGSPAAQRALSTANDLSVSNKTELVVILPASEAERGLAEALGTVRSPNPSTRYTIVASDSVSDVLRGIEQQGGRLLVLPRESTLLTEPNRRALLEHTHFHIVLVS